MKLILHDQPDVEKINERRLFENLALSPQQRMQKLYNLMKLSLLLKDGPIKKPQSKGIVLKLK
ncbi:MAG: hypothetical protein WCP52_13405 [Bacteroidota bacterium]